MRLQGKVAIVTGAASGIGSAIATLFAEEGARVAIADVDAVRGAQLEGKLGADRARFLRTDVSNGAEVRSLVDGAVDAFGGVDILVNCAGTVLFKRLIDTEEAEWDRVISTNLRSVYLCMHHTIPRMLEHGGGAIVSISSNRAIATTPLVSSYDAAKGAIVSLTRTVALEHARDGIRVNCILPGSIDTPLFRSNIPAEGDEEQHFREVSNSIPLGRVGMPLDIARAALFLVGEESSYVTGAQFLVDGGMLAQLGMLRWKADG